MTEDSKYSCTGELVLVLVTMVPVDTMSACIEGAALALVTVDSTLYLF